jgi:5-methylcytosine-specific restriction protein B
VRRLVQLHPSYGYEEFFEGYRPIGEEHGVALAKKDGPLRVLCRNALGWPGHPAVLVLDEMNRANLPRVFGELFFLLEYRDESVGLMYSPGEQFSLPQDFYLIGTMNTADRSVATLDQALRRRFHFFGMFPSEEPVPSMFRGFLTDRHPEMIWLADLLARANTLLADRNVAIGPSHFMRAELDEATARRIWKHSVIPTIRDQFLDDESRADEFDFDLLRDADDEAP